MPGLDPVSAHAHAQILRSGVEQATYTIVGLPGPVTISIGLSFPPAPCTGSCAALMRAADLALYAAKQGGRNRVVVAG